MTFKGFIYKEEEEHILGFCVGDDFSKTDLLLA